MCGIYSDEPRMAGLHAGHLIIMRQQVEPDMVDVAEQLFTALTADLNPHLPVFPALVAMVEAVRQQDFGVLRDQVLVRLPLSIIGQNGVRHQTPLVELLHDSVLMMNMSQITTSNIRQALQQHDLCILFLCSCGIVMGRCPDVEAYYGTEAHRRMDRLRSAIDAASMPVEHVDSFDDITVPTMDLHVNGAERRLFARIEQLTATLVAAGQVEYDWIAGELDHFVAQTSPANPTADTAAA